jgi:hypothetical protein
LAIIAEAFSFVGPQNLVAGIFFHEGVDFLEETVKLNLLTRVSLSFECIKTCKKTNAGEEACAGISH